MTTIKIKKQVDTKRIKITINNKDPIKLKQIKKYASKLIDQYNIKNDKNTYIRVLGDLGFVTLKPLDENIDNMYENEEEYFEDRVREDTKFTECYQVQYVLFT